MKARCLCPKPVWLEFSGNFPKIRLKPPYNEEMLHWRTATTECSRCGVPLCEKCLVLGKYHDDKTKIVVGYINWFKHLCPVCAEEMR